MSFQAMEILEPYLTGVCRGSSQLCGRGRPDPRSGKRVGNLRKREMQGKAVKRGGIEDRVMWKLKETEGISQYHHLELETCQIMDCWKICNKFSLNIICQKSDQEIGPAESTEIWDPAPLQRCGAGAFL